jgi:hypothetical protein
MKFNYWDRKDCKQLIKKSLIIVKNPKNYQIKSSNSSILPAGGNTSRPEAGIRSDLILGIARG